MNDFTHWLYTSYIKPQLDTGGLAECQAMIDRAEFLQDADLEALLDRVAELCATRAFLLGLRTGAGLSGSFRN